MKRTNNYCSDKRRSQQWLLLPLLTSVIPLYMPENTRFSHNKNVKINIGMHVKRDMESVRENKRERNVQ